MQADPSLLTPVVADLGDWNQTSKALGAAIANSPVHYLVNSAFLRRMETFGELTEKSLDQCVIVHLINRNTQYKIQFELLGIRIVFGAFKIFLDFDLNSI